MNSNSLLILNGPGMGSVNGFAHSSFGIESLTHIEQVCKSECEALGINLDFRQSDDPDQIVSWIKEDADRFAALIINQLGCAEKTPINYKKYVTELNVLTSLACPVTEIHLTNVFRDDPGMFETLKGPAGKTSFVCGLGLHSYRLAIRGAASQMDQRS